MAWIGAVVAVAGAATQAKGSRQAARAARRAGENQAAYNKVASEAEAAILDERAEDVIDIAQRDAEEVVRQGSYIKSKAQAAAAASGGGASDKTVLNTMADIEAETEYQALTHLYNGRITARDLGRQAEVALQGGRASSQTALSEGSARAKAHQYQGYGAIIGAAESLYSIYG